MDDIDELVIVMDSPSLEVSEFIDDIHNDKRVTIAHHSLNGDFANHKNYLFSLCTKDYIVNLDADEYFDDSFYNNII